MPTAKKRINLTVDDDLFENLKKIAKRERVSVASVSNDLLERALELREDRYFSEVSEARLAKKSKRLSHKDVWD
jgi:predicted CopG family antitoxin